jgi:prepilin-type N-terminal cleavage/methylation domain-containing protein
MLSKLKKSKGEGFTIIEVMIVLAIAGLILLIVFLAIPALQRNSRNTQRKNDAAAYTAAYSEDVNNNNGVAALGQAAGNAVKAVKAGQLTTIDYNVAAAGAMASIPSPMVDGTVYLRNNSTCVLGSNGQIGTTGGTARQATVSYLIESPGAAVNGNAPKDYASQCVAAG